MKFRFFLIFALAGLLLSGCAVEELPTEGGSILAEMETDHTRTMVTDEGKFTWSAGDQVWIQTTSGHVLGTLSEGEGTSSAEFTYGSYIGDMTGNAVYPYNAGHSVSADVLSFVLPASYDLGVSPNNTNAAMFGVNVGDRLKFSHLAGVMRFNFRNVPAGVSKFTITLDKRINGIFEADLTNDYPVIETEMTSSASEKTVTFHFDALKFVSDMALYVPLPVGTYTTLDLELFAGDVSVWKYSNTVTNKISRKTLKLMPTVTIGGTIGGDMENGSNLIPNNEIWYKSTEKVIPYTDLTVVSNEWNSSTGDGVIVFKDKLTTITSSTFSGGISSGSTSLEKIILPNTIETIGRCAFSDCSSLVEVNMPKSLKRIEDHAFINCSSISALAIPDNVTYIGESAFEDCTGLERTIIGKGVTDIEDSAFSNCAGKLFIDINIGEGWFRNSGFTELIVGEGVRSIGGYAFDGGSLLKVTLPETITTIGESAFSGCLIRSINLPDSITSMGKYAFNGCRLTSLDIPSGLKTIPFGAFQGNPLTRVNLDGVTSIEGDAFKNCDLWELKLPNTLTKIGASAFFGNEKLYKVTIPSSVTSIGEYAFVNCTYLHEVHCQRTTPPTLGSYAFSVWNLTAPGSYTAKPIGCTIYVPSASLSKYRNASNWSTYYSYIMGE